MAVLLKNELLQISPRALEDLKKQYNLDGPGRMEEAVNILREWLQQQRHILKKDFSWNYLAMSIILSKGSLEKAKMNIDKRCTFKTLQPQFYELYDMKASLNNLKDKMNAVLLPKQTSDYYRVYLCKVKNKNFSKDDLFAYHKLCLTMADYILNVDQLNGLAVVMDFSEANMLNVIMAHDWIKFKNFIQILLECYSTRLKGMYFITSSPALETFISLMKPCLSKKVSNRLHALSSPEELSKVLSPNILPKEYGGAEGPLPELFDKWTDLLTSEEHLEIMKDMDGAATDETLREKAAEFSEEYAGITGSFRYLTVD